MYKILKYKHWLKYKAKVFFQMHLKGFGGSLGGRKGQVERGFRYSGVSLSPMLPKNLDMVRSLTQSKLHQLESFAEAGCMEASDAAYQCH